MMRRAFCALALLAAAACASEVQQRVREYNEDGVHLFQKGAYRQAKQSFEAALALTPESANLLYNIGQCHDRLGDRVEAERIYKECLARAPDHAECRHAWAVLLVESGRQPEAVRMVEDWLRARPELSSPYVEDAWLRGRDGDLMHARGRLQQAIDKDPRDSRALAELGRIYEKLDKPGRALLLYERSLTVDPQQPELTRKVADLRARKVKPPRPDD
jgi:tetratricopeptide (TPR) repeat protein